MSDASISRRDILKATARVTAGTALLNASSARGEIATEGRIRLGIVGIGGRASGHIKDIIALPDRCQITAMCDIIPERAKAAIEKIGGGDVKTFDNHMDLAQSGLCDAIIVTTPNYTHKRITLDALQTGHHVLCEKPMATTLADGREMMDAVRHSRRVFAVGLQFRYTPVYLKAKELLDAGAIGDLKYVWAEEFRGDWRKLYDDPEMNARKNWRYFQRLSGGTLIEKACHDFDILGWLINRNPIRVAATGGTSVYGARETLDHASVAIEYEGGAKLTFGLCLFSPVGRDDTRLIGTKGLIEFKRAGQEITLTRRGKEVEKIAVEQGDKSHSTRELYVDFLYAINRGWPPLADIQVGYNALRVGLAGEEAIRRHEVVSMSEF